MIPTSIKVFWRFYSPRIEGQSILEISSPQTIQVFSVAWFLYWFVGPSTLLFKIYLFVRRPLISTVAYGQLAISSVNLSGTASFQTPQHSRFPPRLGTAVVFSIFLETAAVRWPGELGAVCVSGQSDGDGCTVMSCVFGFRMETTIWPFYVVRPVGRGS
jgi:hypothetical protein